VEVYADVVPASLGQAIHRVKRMLRRHAPPVVEFVDSPQVADVQILDVIAPGRSSTSRHESSS
jgi:hypothetical protein